MLSPAGSFLIPGRVTVPLPLRSSRQVLSAVCHYVNALQQPVWLVAANLLRRCLQWVYSPWQCTAVVFVAPSEGFD